MMRINSGSNCDSGGNAALAESRCSSRRERGNARAAIQIPRSPVDSAAARGND